MKRLLVVVGLAAIVGVVAWLLLARRGDGAKSTTTTTTGGSAKLGSAHTRTAATVVPTRKGGRKLSGRVLFHGAPIAATVWLTGGHGGPLVTQETAADGIFVLAELPAERYTLAAFAPKLAGRTVQIDLRTSDKDNVTLRLQACERELAGSVVDASGGAITAARIEGGGATTITGADGRFQLCTANVQLDVIARADGYASEQRPLTSGDSDAIFQLRPEAVVSGVVLLDGAPVPYAQVDAMPDSGRTWDRSVVGGSTVTRDDGTFEVHGIGAGDYDMVSRIEGARTTKPVNVRLELTANAPVQLVLARTIELRGRAHVGAEPAANVNVMWGLDDGPGSYGVTDATGAFALPAALPGPGKFTVPEREIVGGGRRVVGTEPIDLELVPAVAKEGVIRGRVVRNGAPIADARIIAREQSPSYDHGPRSGDDGAFEMKIRGGTVHLAAESDELGLASDDVTVEVTNGQTRDGVVLDLTRSATVTGTVVDETGAPVDGATIQLVGASATTGLIAQNRERGQAVTRGGGAFRVTMLAPDTYSISVVLGAKVDLVKGSTTTIEVRTPGENVEGVKVTILAKLDTIAGRVVDDRGAPVADAAIEVAGVGAKRRADLDGRFSVKVLARRRYTVIARGRPGTERAVQATPGTTDLVITLPSPGSVRVACPAGIKRVRIYPASGSVMEAACGEVIDRMPVGHVFARDADNDARAETQSIGQGEIVSGKETALTLAEVGTREVALRITGGGKPLEKVGCMIDQAGGSVVSSNAIRYTNKTGTMTAKALKAPSRIQCFSSDDAWGLYKHQLDAETTELAIEMPRAEP